LAPRIASDITAIAGLLRWRAANHPDRLGYTFLADGADTGIQEHAGTQEFRISYGELDVRARAIGARLREAGAADGARVILLMPPGLDYVAALFGCLYAAAIAVPAYPPDPLQLGRTLPRLVATLRDASPLAALTTSSLLPYFEQLIGHAPELVALRWLAADETPATDADQWVPPAENPNAIALLQYTSGSTASPRGVMLSHANLLHNSGLIHHFFRMSPDSRGVSWLPPYHDMGLIGGLIQPLYAGIPVTLMSPLDFLRRPLRWLEAITRYGATVSGGPNFAYDLCVRKSTPAERADLDLSSWQVAFNGAEPVRRDTMERFAEAFAPAGFRPEAFLPCYGLAEATLIVSAGSTASAAGHVDPGALQQHRAQPGADAVGAPVHRLTSCGYGAADQRIAIVDPQTREMCPRGRVGEIWLSGPSVALGYWGKQEETDHVFRGRVAGTGDGPFLRTGDLGFLRDGELVVTGRHKDLIIIRGRNHYPQDIEETAQRADPALRPGCAAAFVLEADGEDRLVLVHEVARQADDVDAAAVVGRIRRAVAERHGLQAHTVILVPAGAMPKTSSGKVQRRLCRAQLVSGELPEMARSQSASQIAPQSVSHEEVLAAAPENRRRLLETYLRGLAAAVCGTAADELDLGQSLLAAGLDSLAALQLKHTVQAGLGVSLPLPEMLAGASLSQVISHLTAQLGEQAADRQAGAHLGAPRPSPTTVPPAGRAVALSYGQRSLWFLHQLAPASAAHTVATALRVSAQLDRSALRSSLDTLVSRHPMLRTTFTTRDGEPVQVVHATGQPGFEEHDAGELGEDELAELLTSAARRPFDLASGPLLRIDVYSRPDGRDVILFVAHHIVMDFWSMTILAREFWACYAEYTGGPAAALAEPTATYPDVTRWQESLLSGPAAGRLASYWDEQLAGGVPPLRLPALAGSHASGSRGGSRSFQVSGALTARLRRQAASEGVTLYTLLLAACQALLHRYTGQDDIVVGTPVAGRSRPEFAQVVGYCMNPVLIRSRAAGGSSFRHLLAQARTQVAGALEHQDYPMTLLAERHGIARNGALFEAMFVFNRPPERGDDAAALAMAGQPGAWYPLPTELLAERLPIGQRESAFPLKLTITEAGYQLYGTIGYRCDVLDAPAADRLAGHFTTLLEAVAEDPDRALDDLLRAEGDERARILYDWNATERDHDTGTCVPQLFEQRAGRTPDAVAVAAGEQRLSYTELNERANQLAHFLRGLGVGPESRVGVCLERSPDLLVALLAVLKAGGGYVPADPMYPAERIAAAFADADVAVVVSQQALAGKLPGGGHRVVLLDEALPAIARCPASNPVPAARADDLAYVIYTSGSSGVPKGVEVPHRAIANYTRFAAGYFQIGAHDRMLQFASAAFDASAEEIYPSLVRGATLVLRTDSMLASPARFFDACTREGITILDLPTAYWHELVAGIERDEVAIPGSLRLVIIGGEKALPERVAAWRDRVGSGVRLVNTYGPTEATIVATCCDLSTQAGAPIGRPVSNVRAYLLDERRQPVPVGPVGELYLGGTGLARGYLGRPGLTAERFVPDPHGPAGGRLYRTGDLARYLPDGAIDFVGRTDRQVKLRGFRVELGEIEAVLRRHSDVTDAAVAYRGEPAALAAYVIASGDAGPTADQLRGFLRASLPEHMVPASFMTLPALPRNPSGKIDYAALPAPAARGEAVAPADLPGTREERVLASIWREMLNLPEVGVRDDFFALGGHSLLATKALARVSDMLGRELPVRAVFESPTIAALARLLADAPSAQPAPIPRVPRDQPLPLSFAQERVWFLQYIQPGTTAYNVPRALRIHGDLDPRTLTRVFDDLEVRHEILRTTFPDVDGVPVQRIHEPRGISVGLADLSELAERDREERMRDLVAAAGREPFDVANGPLLRVTLIRLAPDDHVLAVTEHHLIHDGWAQGVFLRDFLEFFASRAAGRAPHLPSLPIQYADFAAWQRSTIRGERLDDLLSYWRQRLAGAPRELRLRTDRPRPRVLSSHGDQQTLVIDGQLGSALREFCRETATTLFMTMFTVFAALLYGYSGQQDIVSATGIANRQRPETENLLGMIINTILLRADLTGRPSFHTLLARIRQTCLEAYAHQDMPFEKLVESLRPARDPSRVPLFQVMFSFLNTPLPALETSGLRFEVLDTHNQSAKFDLNVVIVPHAEYHVHDFGSGPDDGAGRGAEITVLMEYSTDLFDASTIRQMLGQFQTLLGAMIARPHEPVEEHLERLSLSPAPVAGPDPSVPGTVS